MKTDVVSITEVSHRLGLAISTLRYWEERGLIAPAERRAGRRHYAWEQIQQIIWIQTLQQTGQLSLDEIAQVLRSRDGTHDWQGVLRGRIAAIEAQLDRLERARDHLRHALTCPASHPDRDCTVLRAEAVARWEATGRPAPAAR